jgi:anti-anti-sigma factor
VQFQSRHFGTIAVAAPNGRLGHAEAADFEHALVPLARDPGVTGLVVDLGGVEYISSVGLRVLMLAAKEMRARKARIAAAAMQPIVAEIFAISRFDSVYEVFPSLRDALAAMSPQAAAAFDASG